MKRILHIAVENFAGLPYSLVKAERQMGFDSHLLTMYRTFQGFEEEYSLDLPFISSGFAGAFRKGFGNTGNLSTSRNSSTERPPVFRYRNPVAKLLFNIRDSIWKDMLRKTKLPGLLATADVVVLDGGLGITRHGGPVNEWAEKGGKIVEIFYGTDLRTRGIIPETDELASLRFTMEYDHLSLYPGIEFLFFPFDSTSMPQRNYNTGDKIRIGHSPTKRETKGSDYIIKIIEGLMIDYPVELVLIEGLGYTEAIELKSTCNIFIDQMGELGYGVSGLESLAMGIPTLVELKPDFEGFLGDHPFVNVSRDNLAEKLADLVENPEKRKRLGLYGQGWVKEKHSPMAAAGHIVGRMREKGLLQAI